MLTSDSLEMQLRITVDEDGNKFDSADILKENIHKFTESIEDIEIESFIEEQD